ncbi:MAG: helicase-related protein [Acidimicrobiales bacterium]
MLTSATPHNGDPESFAELIRLLDPTAVVDADDLTGDDIAHLYVRRHKAHEEVAHELGSQWAERKEPQPITVDASPAENAMFAELADTWTHPVEGKSPSSGSGSSLFPWTLFKAALSSHLALLQTVESRRKTLARAADEDGGLTAEQAVEDEALERLGALAAKIEDDSSSKLAVLVDNLRGIGVGKGSDIRVVVFSERIATLRWLARTVPPILGLKTDQVLELHGGLSDVNQMDVIEQFGLSGAPVRLLFTGDMASEGVNLHRECSHLIHFDLPWSLITIEQRNGRIDRYGQTERPDVRALLLTPDHPASTGDVRIITRLLEREHHAHRAFGESGSLLGLHAPDAEEEQVMKWLRDRTRPDDADALIPDEPQKAFDIMTLLAGTVGGDQVPTYRPPSLFDSDFAFVDEALHAAFVDPVTELDIRTDDKDPSLLSLEPPRDLVNRLSALPQSYLTEQRIAERLKVTASPEVANSQLDEARASTESSWPEVSFLSPLHPFVDWLVDKVLVDIGRNQAPVIVAKVDRPTYLVQGMYSNGRGQPQIVEWMAISPDDERVDDMFEALTDAGVTSGTPNPGTELGTDPLEAHLDAVVTIARDELARRRTEHDQKIEDLLAEPAERLASWKKRHDQLSLGLDERRRRDREKYAGSVRDDTEELIESMRTEGEPLVRVVAVLVGRGT